MNEEETPSTPAAIGHYAPHPWQMSAVALVAVIACIGAMTSAILAQTARESAKAWAHHAEAVQDDVREIAADMREARPHEVIRPMLNTPLATIENAAVICPGSASSATRVPAAGTAASAITIVNTSATCVQVGGIGVTSVTGGGVGAGCGLGTAFAFDAKEAYCVSSAVGTVTVQVLYGRL